MRTFFFGVGGGSIWDDIKNFFVEDVKNSTPILVAFIMGPVVIILVLVLVILCCCCCRSCTRKKHRKKFDLA